MSKYNVAKYSPQVKFEFGEHTNNYTYTKMCNIKTKIVIAESVAVRSSFK